MRRLVQSAAAAALASVAAFVAFVVTGLFTPNLPVDCSAAFVVFAAVFHRTSRRSWRTSFIAAVCVLILAALPSTMERIAPPSSFEDPGLAAALARTTLALPVEDLGALASVFRGRRIVAMGEATHGTHEFFQIKHRLLALLVTRLGFRDYAMELSPEHGAMLDRYVQGEDVQPGEILYWPWATEDVRIMLAWMRDFNTHTGKQDRIRFHGIDPRSGDRDRVMAENIGRIVDRLPAGRGVAVWAHNAHISTARGRMGSYLKERYGRECYLLGFEFDAGSFTSRTFNVQVFSTGPTAPHYYAHALARLGNLPRFLDFESMNPRDDGWRAARVHTSCRRDIWYFDWFPTGTRCV